MKLRSRLLSLQKNDEQKRSIDWKKQENKKKLKEKTTSKNRVFSANTYDITSNADGVSAKRQCIDEIKNKSVNKSTKSPSTKKDKRISCNGDGGKNIHNLQDIQVSDNWECKCYGCSEYAYHGHNYNGGTNHFDETCKRYILFGYYPPSNYLCPQENCIYVDKSYGNIYLSDGYQWRPFSCGLIMFGNGDPNKNPYICCKKSIIFLDKITHNLYIRGCKKWIRVQNPHPVICADTSPTKNPDDLKCVYVDKSKGKLFVNSNSQWKFFTGGIECNSGVPNNNTHDPQCLCMYVDKDGQDIYLSDGSNWFLYRDLVTSGKGTPMNEGNANTDPTRFCIYVDKENCDLYTSDGTEWKLLRPKLKIEDLTDVCIDSPTSGQSLIFLDGCWTNANFTSNNAVKNYQFCGYIDIVQEGVNNDCQWVDDISDKEPRIVTTCFVNQLNEPRLTGTAVVAYDLNAPPLSVDQTTQKYILANHGQVGPTYGVSYRWENDDLFVGSFYKRLTQMTERNGTRDSLATVFRLATVIKSIKEGNDPAPVSSTFIDLDQYADVLGLTAPVAGVDNHSYNDMGGLSDNDVAVIPETLKKGLGDIDISNDGVYIFVVNLYDKYLYKIPILKDGVVTDYTDSLDTRANSIARFNLVQMARNIYDRNIIIDNYGFPLKSDIIKGDKNLRPFGLKYYHGRIYFSITNTEEFKTDGTVHTSQLSVLNARKDLFASVFSFDGCSSDTLKHEITLKLDYSRDSSTDNWLPWSNDFDNITNDTNFTHQAILSDIEFDVPECESNKSVNMIIGFRNRYADMYLEGIQPVGPEPQAEGDMLRVLQNGDKWVMEPLSRQVFSEYFEDFNKHNESCEGAIAVSKTRKLVFSTFLDPINFQSSGWASFFAPSGEDLVGGKKERLVEVFFGSSGVNSPFFDKANGLGDLEIFEKKVEIPFCMKVCDAIIVINNTTFAIKPLLEAVISEQQTMLDNITYDALMVKTDGGRVSLGTNLNFDQLFTVVMPSPLTLKDAYQFIIQMSQYPCNKIIIPVIDFFCA